MQLCEQLLTFVTRLCCRCDKEVRKAVGWRRGVWDGQVRCIVDHSSTWRRRSNDGCHAA